MSFCGRFIDRQVGSCKKQLLQLLIFQDCLCHCCLIVGCFCVVALLFLSLVVWSSCELRSERGPAVPQLLVSTSTAQLPLTHPQCVSQKGFLVGTPLLSTYFHHCSPNLPVHPSQPNPGLQRGLQPVPRPIPRPHSTDRPALSSPCAPRYGLRLPGCNLVTARPAGWKVGLGSGSSAGCLWKPSLAAGRAES